jgi:AraC-like DNA-binding protein
LEREAIASTLLLMDVLAEVLATTRVGAAIYGRVELRAPWAMRFDRAWKAGFHVVQRGGAWLRPGGGIAPIQLSQGDVVVLPRGWMHTLSDRPDAEGELYPEVVAAQRRRRASGPPGAVLLCGAYEFDHDGVHPLLSILPPVLHAVAGDEAIGNVVRILDAEVGGSSPGADTIARRLVDVLFVLAIRSWLARQPEGAAGWLGALRDPSTQRALACLHGSPARDWTLEDLARAVGVSRATLARRFTGLVGEPPLTYLRRWRMTLAAQAMRERDLSLGELAELSGYASDIAFHKAFARERGCTPASYRKQLASAREARD